VLRQALAFPMYGAAAWLTWVMSQEVGPAGVLAVLVGAVLVGMAAWAFGLAQQSEGRGRRLGQSVAAAAALAALAMLPGIGAAPAITPAARAAGSADAGGGIERFSAARLAALLRDGRPVFVDATAAWCITCQVNDRVALTARVRAAFAGRHIAYLVADWTRQDGQVTALLRALGRDGVPLYVFYPGGGRPPELLPQIRTERVVLDAIGAAPG
jgi:thiol:disulfide interchange protein DsbD